MVSRYDGKAVTGQDNGQAVIMTLDESNPAQKWVWSSSGNQLINVASNLPLITNEGQSWTWDEEFNMIKDNRLLYKSLSRSWSQEDGTEISTNWGQGVLQYWIPYPYPGLEPVENRYKIVSRYDNRVIEGLSNGNAIMMTWSNSLNQIWTR